MELTNILSKILPTLIVGVYNNIFDKSIEKLVMDKADFESITKDRILLEELPAINTRLIRQFLKSDDVELIVKQIYVDDADKTREEIKEDFCLLFSRYFDVNTEQSYEFASNLFDVLVEGCQIILDKFISKGNLAAHDAKSQNRFRQLNDGVGRIDRNMQNTADVLQQIQSAMPWTAPGHSIEKLKSMLDFLDTETKSNPDFDIGYTNANGKREIKLTPKNKDLGIDIKFKLSHDKLNGKKDIAELINSELKNGNSIIFSEEEIEHFSIKNPQFENFGTPLQIEITPIASGKSLYLTFLIGGTDLAYHDVEMKHIYKNGDEGSLMSQNLPFKFILNMQKDTTSMNLIIKTDWNEISILDLNKLLKFVSTLNEGHELVCKDSKRDKQLFSGQIHLNFEIDKGVMKLVENLAEIDTTFHVDFMYPEVVTTENLILIEDIISFIKHSYINTNINNFELTLRSYAMDEILRNYEKYGFVNNFVFTSQVTKNLFDKEICLGNGTISISKSMIQENTESLREKSKTSDEVKITLIPFEFDGKTHFE